ncbi:MAG: hypothetical protein M1836_000917 [Candelina mexicana]|nr:MAG: hypothetical protein M1836_000917 [Candelina mexicana]
MASLHYNSPWLVRVLHMLPIPAVQYFAQSRKWDPSYDRTAFNKYVDLYGRQPHLRKELITLFIKGTGLVNPLTTKLFTAYDFIQPFPNGLPRVDPSEAKVSGFFVPAGTIVSMQNRTLYHNAAVFPDPLVFIPARWIDAAGGTKEMDESFTPWSKGPRACIGQHLATMAHQTSPPAW